MQADRQTNRGNTITLAPLPKKDPIESNNFFPKFFFSMFPKNNLYVINLKLLKVNITISQTSPGFYVSTVQVF